MWRRRIGWLLWQLFGLTVTAAFIALITWGLVDAIVGGSDMVVTEIGEPDLPCIYSRYEYLCP